MALPPYIARPDGPTVTDDADYQTVFARAPGAVAAPTAGLHFTPGLLAALDAAGVRRATVTLHVGAGTFLPMRGDPDSHRMHPERGEVSEAACRAIRAASTVVAVGTTTLRLLESAATPDGVAPFDGETAIFIRPGFPIPRRASAGDQFPPATLDPVHAGLRIRGPRTGCAAPMPTRSPAAIASTRMATVRCWNAVRAHCHIPATEGDKPFFRPNGVTGRRLDRRWSVACAR